MSETRPPTGVRAAAAWNLLKAWLLVLVLAALAGGLGWLLADERGALLFAFCSLLASTAAWWYGDRALLGTLGARPYALAEDPILSSTVERLSARIGVRPPKLYLLDDGFPRSLAVGRGPRSASIGVSTGLLRSLPAAELEAVLAHELAHVRRRDVLTQMLSVLLATTLVETSRLGGFLSRALLYVFGPIGAAVVHVMLSPKRELAADALAASVTGEPDELADALTRLDRASDLVHFEASPATAPLYVVDPFAAEGLARMFATHPPLADRIRRLRELGAGSNGRVTKSLSKLAG